MGRAIRLDAAGEEVVYKFDNYYALRSSPTISITLANNDSTIMYSLDDSTYTSTLPDATGYRYVYVKIAYNTTLDYITKVTYTAILDTSNADWFAISKSTSDIWHNTDSGTNQAAWEIFYRERF
jgi:hypothetical protein